MEYRTKSAEVLNSSDDFERKLSWILFKQEQEVILYQTTQKSTWVPGIPLRNRPVRILNFDAQYIRPMFEIMDTFHNQDRVYPPALRCKSCDVYWNPDVDKSDGCWMCGGPGAGVARPWTKRPDFSVSRFQDYTFYDQRRLDELLYMAFDYREAAIEEIVSPNFGSMVRCLYQSVDVLQPDVEIAFEEPPSIEECDIPFARPFEINSSVADEFAIEELEVDNVELDIPDEIPERLPRSQSIRIIQETDPIRFRTRLTFEVPITEQRRRRDL